MSYARSHAHGLTADLLQGLQPLANACNRCNRLDFEVEVCIATAEVVDDKDLVTLARKIQSARPATEAITTENDSFYKSKNLTTKNCDFKCLEERLIK